MTPTIELRKDGDYYILATISTFKTTEIKFKPGEEFDEERADGAKVLNSSLYVHWYSRLYKTTGGRVDPTKLPVQ